MGSRSRKHSIHGGTHVPNGYFVWGPPGRSLLYVTFASPPPPPPPPSSVGPNSPVSRGLVHPGKPRGSEDVGIVLKPLAGNGLTMSFEEESSLTLASPTETIACIRRTKPSRFCVRKCETLRPPGLENAAPNHNGLTDKTPKRRGRPPGSKNVVSPLQERAAKAADARWNPKQKRRERHDEHARHVRGERWISMQLGVWLDRYPFNNGYLVYME